MKQFILISLLPMAAFVFFFSLAAGAEASAAIRDHFFASGSLFEFVQRIFGGF